MKRNFSSLHVIVDVFPFLWTKQEGIRFLFLFSLCLVGLTICFNMSIPLILKHIVSELSFLKKGNLGYSLSLLILSYGLIWTLSQMMEHVRTDYYD